MNNLSILNESMIHYAPINWLLLAQAQNYYVEHGFLYCEVPYLIPEQYGALTKPHNDQSFVLNNHLFAEQAHELVGSAEQGFIYLLATNQLKGDKLITVTPCFRTENYGMLHLPWFMKCELFHLSNSLEDCQKMIKIAYDFYFKHCQARHLEIVQTDQESWDINLNGIEIASFGLRHLEFGNFIYGTGLALPRFEQSKKYYESN